jgi:CubicO group peptidase (beta-lactamase class C family)
LQKVVEKASATYNCSFSIAMKSASMEISVAHGNIGGRNAIPSDKFLWASVTKIVTAASIMQLVSQGHLHLHDRVAPLVDPLLKSMAQTDPTQKFASMEDLWGGGVISNITVESLLAMHSGLRDFDTYKDCSLDDPSYCKDPLRQKLYAYPAKLYSPTELLALPYVANNYYPSCTEKKVICYSTTNFVLLGLVLAAHAGKASWIKFDQSSFLPPSLKGQLLFARKGSPKDFTAVHGFDRTPYNMPKGQHNNHDVWEVHGLFSGWTGTNLVASASAVAQLAWEVYGPTHSFISRESTEQMIPKIDHDASQWYGLGTADMSDISGHPVKSRYGRAYGHAGSTYGYQSGVAYFPGLEVSIAVATNIETDSQTQLLDALCQAYNAVYSVSLQLRVSCRMEDASGKSSCRCQQV